MPHVLDPLLAPDWRSHLSAPRFGAISRHSHNRAVHVHHVRPTPDPSPPAPRPPGVFGLVGLTQVAILAALAAGTLMARTFRPRPRRNRLPPLHGVLWIGLPRLRLDLHDPPRPQTHPRRPTPAAIRTALLAILLASPMFWLGFIQNRMLLAPPPASRSSSSPDSHSHGRLDIGVRTMPAPPHRTRPPNCSYSNSEIDMSTQTKSTGKLCPPVRRPHLRKPPPSSPRRHHLHRLRHQNTQPRKVHANEVDLSQSSPIDRTGFAPTD